MDKPHFVMMDGPPRQRGRTHGEALRTVIREVIARWQEAIARARDIRPADYVSWLARGTRFDRAIERWTPGLLEEVRGVGEGAGVDFELIYAWQMLDEHPWLLDDFVAGRSPAQAQTTDRPEAAEQAEHCSSLGLAARSGQPALIAQNLDLPAIKDGAQTVLHVRYPDSDLELLTVTQAGTVASLGVNNRSLGVCVNALPQLDWSPDGLPVCFVVRGLLEKRDLGEARAFLGRITHATGQNYVLGSPDGVADVECSTGRAVPFRPFDDRDDVCHTNHPLANPDRGKYQAARSSGPLPGSDSSRSRYEFLVARLAESDLPRTADGIKAILSDPAVCRPAGPQRTAFTAASAVIELSASPVLHATAGPPDRARFERFEM